MSKRTVLVIEDEEVFAKLFVSWLTSAGYDVITASDGNEGARKYILERPSLIITDMFMPVRDGIDVIRAVRQHDSAIPIIAISGGGERGDLIPLKAARELGATAAIRKSELTRSWLLEEIRRLLA